MSDCKKVSAQELAELVREGKVQLIDVREKDEHAYEHIPDSQCIPVSEFSDVSMKSIAADNKKVIFYCQSGNRTRQMQPVFERLGLRDIGILAGGITEWKKAKGKVVTAEQASFPIMRQVQIVVGFMVLLGALLGYFVSLNFIWVSAFFGAGLFFAGVSGTCALAKMLSFLPYNKGGSK